MTTINGFIKIQRIQWLNHVMRCSADAAIRIVLDWKPERKMPWSRPWKR